MSEILVLYVYLVVRVEVGDLVETDVAGEVEGNVVGESAGEGKELCARKRGELG